MGYLFFRFVPESKLFWLPAAPRRKGRDSSASTFSAQEENDTKRKEGPQMKKKCECDGDRTVDLKVTYTGKAYLWRRGDKRDLGIEVLPPEGKQKTDRELEATCELCEGRVELPEDIQLFYYKGMIR